MTARRPLKFALVSGTQPSFNPRLRKEADLIAAMGGIVHAVHPRTQPGLVPEDEAIALSGGWLLNAPVRLEGWRGSWTRACRRAAVLVARHVGVTTAPLHGYGTSSLAREVQRLKPDVVIGHQEAGLLVAVNYKRRYPATTVLADIEDWYSENLTADSPKCLKQDLVRLERQCTISLDGIATTSEALATAWHAQYGKRPTVVYNAFATEARVPDPDSGPVSLGWMSQTIGPGRGLEVLAAALGMIRHSVQLHLIGRYASGFEAWINENVRVLPHVNLQHWGPVLNAELPALMGRAQIGLCLERSRPRSRDLTVTNKMFHYLSLGIPVIASRTSGQCEIAEKAVGSIFLVDENDPADLARVICELSENRHRVAVPRHPALTWEAEMSRLRTHLLQSIPAWQ